MMEENTYLPADQAIEMLGEKPAKFYYHVDRKEIATETPARPGRGKKNNHYLVSDILQVKKRLQEQRQTKKQPTLIDWALAADVPAALKLSFQMYPGEVDLREAALYQAWRKNNPYLTMAAFSPDRSECYATIQVVPLVSEQIILDVLSGKRDDNSILPDEIPAYDHAGPFYLLVASATCLPDRPQLLYQVLAKYVDFWIGQYPDRYIKRVYAQAATDDGMRIVQHFYMAPRLDLAHNAFVLDLAYPPVSRMIKHFKARLTEIAPLPDDLQWPPPAAVSNPPIVSRPAAAPTTEKPRRQIATSPAGQAPDNAPEGTLSLEDFAQSIGLHRTGLIAVMSKHVERTGQEIEHVKKEIAARPGRYKRFFTPDQQEKFKQIWSESKKK